MGLEAPEVLAGAAPARLHLVGDERDAVLVEHLFNAAKNPSGGTMKPPTPWIGSAIRQATSPAVVVSMTWRRSAAQAALKSSSPRSANGLRWRSPLWR